MRRLGALLFGLAACSGLLAGPAAASDVYPSRIVKVIVPFPPGSATDGVARLVAERLKDRLKQPFIIDNKPGADGVIAARAAMQAAPDGYTLFLTTNSTHAVNVSLYRSLPYDPVKDFTPVAGIMKIPQMLVVRKEFPADDFAGFLTVAKAAKAADKPLTFASGNTSSRAAGEMLKVRTGIDMTHVAYRGTPQALTDLVGGHIDVFFADPASAAPFIQEGKLKILGLADAQRLPTFPDVPTMAELGLPGFEIVSWVALFMPAHADPKVVDLLNREMRAVLQEPDVKEYLKRNGATAFPTTPAELGTFVESEIKRWAEIVEVAGIERK